jgi:heavy metal efflux system protein
MIRAIIAWSLQNRPLVLLGAMALVAVGLHSASQLNVEAYPDPTPPLVEVLTQNPGSSPEEMERLVGIPLETALNGMPGLVDLRSTSIAGLNDIKCRFAYGTNFTAARQEVLNRIATVNLPERITPELSPWSPTGEIVRYVLEGPGYTLSQIKAVQDWVLNRVLKQVPGVIDVTGFGGTIKQYQVLIDPRKLNRYGITLRQVEDAIEQSNANVGGDVLTLGAQAHNVRAIGLLGGGTDPLDPALVENAIVIEMEKLEDIKNVVVTSVNNTPIFVRELADVVVGHQPRLGVVGRDGEDDVVEGIILMRRGEKSLPTATAVAAKFAEIEREGTLPPGMKISVFNQRVDLVHVTTHNVLHNLLVGMGLVVAVLFVFLGDVASACIVAVAIPLSLLFSVTMLYLQGKSANLLSIGAVDFGIIVDSSVIIVENIYRHVTGHGDRNRSLNDRILAAAAEIERPLFFSTAIIICAFLPLFFMSGPAGALFGPMANTYALAIGGALILAVTLAPVLCSFFFGNKGEEKETIIDHFLKAVFGTVLKAALSARYAVLAAVLGLVAFTAALIPGLGMEFMPPLEEGNLWIRALMPRTSSLEAASRMAPRLRAVIAEIPEVRGVMSHVGRPDDGTDVTSYFNLEFNVPLKPMDQWRPGMTREKIEAELQQKFAEFPGLDFNFSQLIRDNVEEALSGVKGANSIKVFGSDLATLEEVGNSVAAALRRVDGIVNVGVFRVLGQPNLEIALNRQACARYGLSIADVESVVQVAIGGRAFSEMVEGEKLYDIVLRLPRELRSDPEDISRIPIDLPAQGDGARPGPRFRSRKWPPSGRMPPGLPTSTVRTTAAICRSSLRCRTATWARPSARPRPPSMTPPAGVKMPPGYRVEWSGEFAQMQEAFGKLKWLVPLSIGLIIVLLHTAFGQMRYALMVMFNVLVAAMGGVWALRLTDTHFSISAAVGFISIFGVAVQNGVLLITYFNALRAEGLSPADSVYRGVMVRLRPVIMTSLTAILGLLPAAVATSIGSQAQRPLAIVVVGGMLSAMILPQIILPVLYTFFPAPAGPRTVPQPGTDTTAPAAHV